MANYPDTVPFDAINRLVGRLRGQHVDNADLVAACYDLLGYALYCVYSVGSIPPTAAAGYMNKVDSSENDYNLPHLSNENMAYQLEQFCKQNQNKQNDEAQSAMIPLKAKLPPWVIPLVLNVIQQVLSNVKG
jgi:hypothetical protein